MIQRCNEEELNCVNINNPLKQGLKLVSGTLSITPISIVNINNPLKQGLKLIGSSFFSLCILLILIIH